jgi:UDP-N-acetylmuramoyl-L-alanyl-D-glutamate--2,6-diaminopimelate ligase
VRIGDLIHGQDIRLVGDDPGGALSNLRVCDITEDSRTVMPGSLFIARQGEKADGKRFIAGAIQAGAVAILADDPAYRLPEALAASRVALLSSPDVELAAAGLAERFYGDPSSKMIVIGVTGTNGKTTTTFLIHQMLNALGIRCGLIGTVFIDDGVEVAAASLTTPPAVEISRTFARMHEADCRAAVMEVSSHALDQRRVGAIKFNAGVFTNLTGDHLDYHGTMEAYAAAKARLFAMLPEDGVAVVNIQDPAHSGMVKGCKAPVVRCAVDGPKGLAITGGTAPETVCRARVVGADTTGTTVEFTGPWGHRTTRVPLVGAFNVMNALEAVATVHALFGGTDEDAISFEIIAGALERASAPPGRLEPVTAEGAPIQVFVDYAHTDDALQTVLTVLREAMGTHLGPGLGTSEIGQGPRPDSRELWCVFGCGGDRDRTKRPRMGKVAAELADRVIVTSDNPRTEDPGAIIKEILVGIGSGRAAAHHRVEPDREAAIRLAIREARPGDTIIIAGKGHEDYQILPDGRGGTVKRHFDDREVARAALRERGIAVRASAPSRPTEDDESVIG